MNTPDSSKANASQGFNLEDSISERATTAIAGVGLTMPAWWPYVEMTSNVFAALVPILSAIWLLFQICKAVARLVSGGGNV